jgi:hypothetical protein
VEGLDYQEIIGRRRALVIAPFRSLTDVGFDGPWVTPYQISSQSPDGPALVALHWLEEETIRVQRPVLEKFGYLPDIRFNTVIDMALKRQGLKRSDIYVTQTFHLIPQTRSEQIPLSDMAACGRKLTYAISAAMSASGGGTDLGRGFSFCR